MFDFGVGYSELFVLGLIAVLVIGPKDLPKVMRMIGQTKRKLSGMAREFQGHLDSAMKETGVDELKQGLKAAKQEIDTATGQDFAKPPMTPAATAPKFPAMTATTTSAVSAPLAAIPPAVTNDFGAVFGSSPTSGETRVGGHLVQHAEKPAS